MSCQSFRINKELPTIKCSHNITTALFEAPLFSEKGLTFSSQLFEMTEKILFKTPRHLSRMELFENREKKRSLDLVAKQRAFVFSGRTTDGLPIAAQSVKNP